MLYTDLLCLTNGFEAFRRYEYRMHRVMERNAQFITNFTAQRGGEVLSMVLYASEDVVPGSAFEKTKLPVIVADETAEIILPPHSIAQIKMAAE